MRRSLLFAVVLGGLAACGKEGGAPATPTPSVTTVSVAINAPADMLKINGVDVFSATATMSDGTARAVTPVWASDNAAVATVDGSGKVTGIGSGQATISAIYETLRGTRAVQIVPDYQGSWTGEYTVTSCQHSGDFAAVGWCDAALADGLTSLTMTLTQVRDAVSGQWTHDRMSGAAQGTIETTGTLPLAGNGYYEGTLINIGGWRSVSADNQNQTGRFTMTFASPTWSGSADVSVEIRTCTKRS